MANKKNETEGHEDNKKENAPQKPDNKKRNEKGEVDTKNTDELNFSDDDDMEGSTEFLKNEDHIEFIGSLFGDVFESEEEALDALGRIAINGKRLTNITDLEEAVRIIKQAIAQSGISAVAIEENGTFRAVEFPDYDTDDIKLDRTEEKRHKPKPPPRKLDEEKIDVKEEEPVKTEGKEEKEPEPEKEPEKKSDREIVLEYPENDRTEDVYTFKKPEEFNLKFDSYSDEFLNENVSGIVVLSRLSGIPLEKNGNSKDMLERAADRLYVNGMPAIMFYGLGKKEKLTEEDYNTLGTSIAATLKKTFMDNEKGNYVMFRGEREDTFTAFTMSSDSLPAAEPQKVELFSSFRKRFSSPESIEKNQAEYDKYISDMEKYQKNKELMDAVSEANRAAASVIPLDKIRKTSIEELQREKGTVPNKFTPTAPVPHMEKTAEMNKEPEMMAPGMGSLSPRKNRPSDGDKK